MNYNGQQGFPYSQPQQGGYYGNNQLFSMPNSFTNPNMNPTSEGIDWVSSEYEARNYPSGANSKIFLIDRFNNVFYTKTTDNMGNMTSFRVFDYNERKIGDVGAQAAPGQTGSMNLNAQPENNFDSNKYVTKDELNKKFDELMSFIDTKTSPNKGVKKNG